MRIHGSTQHEQPKQGCTSYPASMAIIIVDRTYDLWSTAGRHGLCGLTEQTPCYRHISYIHGRSGLGWHVIPTAIETGHAAPPRNIDVFTVPAETDIILVT